MVEHAAVITGKDHQRVVTQSVVFEARENLTDDPVEFMDEVTIESTLAGALKTFGRREGVMNVGCRQIQKEGFVLAFFDPLDGFLCERRADLVIVEQLVSFLRSTELIGTSLRGLWRNRRDRRGALRIPAKINQRIGGIATYDAIVFHIDIRRSAVHNRHSKVVIKTEILRPGTQRFLPVVRSLSESQMPFPQDRRVVATVLENIRNRRFSRCRQEAAR